MPVYLQYTFHMETCLSFQLESIARVIQPVIQPSYTSVLWYLALGLSEAFLTDPVHGVH